MEKKLSCLSDDKYGLKTIAQILIGIIIYMISQFFASLVVDVFYRITRYENTVVLLLARCVFEILFFVASIKLYILRILKLDLEYFRTGKSRVSLISIIVAVLLPCSVIAFFFFLTEGEITIVEKEQRIIVLAAAVKVALSAGITEELLFRGYIMKLVEQRWNKTAAVIVPSVVFAMLHSVKGMDVSNMFLLLIAGTLVGSMFSVITIKTDNVFNAVLVHGLWNFMVLGMISISPLRQGRAMVYFRQETDNVLLTGGNHGVEASLVAMLGYCIVTALYLLKGKKQPV